MAVDLKQTTPAQALPVKTFGSPTRPNVTEGDKERWLAEIRREYSAEKNWWNPAMPDLEDLSVDAWSAKRLDPLRYDACCLALAEGMSMDAASKVFRINKKAIAEILASNPTLQQQLANYSLAKLKQASLLISDRLANETEDLEVAQLASVGKAVHDQIALLEGRPTSISETRVKKSSLVDTNELLRGCVEVEEVD